MGTIQERVNNKGTKTFRAQVRLKGTKPISATFQRKTDATRWIQKTETEIRQSTYFDSSESKKHTFSDLVDRFLKDYDKSSKSKQAHVLVLNWWKKQIGFMTLDKITTPLIKEHWDSLNSAVSERTGKHRSNRTLNSYLESISTMFSIAVREYGWMKENPALKIKKKTIKNERTRFLDDQELEKFLKAVDADENTYLKPAIFVSLSTGGRKSEVLGLKWSDVNFTKGRVIFRDTKNGDSRSAALGASALESLKEHAKLRRLDSEYVFPKRRTGWKKTDIKNPLPWEDLTSAFNRAKNNANIKNFRWHDMRHCVATYLLANGASLGEVGKILGHRTSQMTWRYAHLAESRADELVREMANSKY